LALQKKICLLGTSAVGKTSLVAQFVRGVFDERYLTTIGVKIDKKAVEVEGRAVNLLLWDLNGEDRFQRMEMSYLRGAAGYLVVVDGTRRVTLDAALALAHRAQASLGDAPRLLLLNKADLEGGWDLSDETIADLEAEGWTVLRTSAKTGAGVEEAFLGLAQQLLSPAPSPTH
jgi:small GTP-binding protein